MAVGNGSFVTENILMGLTDHPVLQLPLYFFFLANTYYQCPGEYGLDNSNSAEFPPSHPMYFFLFNLSFIDLCFTPKMLMNFILKNIVFYQGCMTQFYFCFFAISECYVAICNPLLYNIGMSLRVCSNLMFGSYLMAFSGAMTHTGCMLRLTCDANINNHYFCDILLVLQLSCTSTYINELVVVIVSGIKLLVPSITIFLSYGFIVCSIFHINSTEGKFKAFRTFSSHIMALSLFFGSTAYVYLQPCSAGSLNKGKTPSVFYTNVVPMMNPLIYSLRNKDVKLALKKKKP